MLEVGPSSSEFVLTTPTALKLHCPTFNSNLSQTYRAYRIGQLGQNWDELAGSCSPLLIDLTYPAQRQLSNLICNKQKLFATYSRPTRIEKALKTKSEVFAVHTGRLNEQWNIYLKKFFHQKLSNVTVHWSQYRVTFVTTDNKTKT